MPQLAAALELAQELSATQKWNDQHGGMATVGVRWNPYESGWEAFASWSSNKQIVSETHAGPAAALEFLITLLRGELQTVGGKA